MVVVVPVSSPEPGVGAEPPPGGGVGGAVAAQVPLANRVGEVPQGGEVLRHQAEAEGEGVRSGANQDTALHPCMNEVQRPVKKQDSSKVGVKKYAQENFRIRYFAACDYNFLTSSADRLTN